LASGTCVTALTARLSLRTPVNVARPAPGVSTTSRPLTLLPSIASNTQRGSAIRQPPERPSQNHPRRLRQLPPLESRTGRTAAVPLPLLRERLMNQAFSNRAGSPGSIRRDTVRAFLPTQLNDAGFAARKRRAAHHGRRALLIHQPGEVLVDPRRRAQIRPDDGERVGPDVADNARWTVNLLLLVDVANMQSAGDVSARSGDNPPRRRRHRHPDPG